ncbi:UNVERIFIED_CONTAM: Cyclin-U1-1 [Sesamum calycinum]|uniref:Cyclin-U1-1 n=1 Tax=Sesamum calycinum TaxID=2727403 RepID=A0AAW2JKZ1_9LAMI
MLTGGEPQHLQARLPEPIHHDPSTTPRVLSILSHVLEKLVARNDQLSSGGEGGSAGWGKNLSAFHGVRPPAISLEKYVERIYKYTKCSRRASWLLVTSVMVASKILDDVHYNNAFYARVGGVSNAELNRLELELLFLLDFGVSVSSRVFESYCQHLEKEMLCNGVVERPAITHNIDDVTEISVEDTQTSSPPQLV